MSAQDERTVPEALPRKEPVCNRVVFGEGDEIDTDQMWTYCLAKKLYFIPPDAAVTTSYGVYNADLQDPKCLVIEGIKKDSELRNVPGFNNFDNGPDGEGAVEMALRNTTFLNSKRGIPAGERQRFDVLLEWLKYSESDKRGELPFPDVKGQFKREELECLPALFHALRFKSGNKAQETLENAYGLFQDLLNPFRTELIQEKYQEALADYQRALEADRIVMNEAIQQGKLQSVRTLAGFELATFDVSSLPLQTHYGAMEEARKNSNADIVLLVDEINGKKQVKISISSQKAADSQNLASINLAEVVPFALKPFEALEGGGYEFAVNSEAGGHEHIVGLARQGTAVHTEQLRQAVTKLFDALPLTLEQLTDASREIADLAGCGSNYFPEMSQLDTNSYHLNRRGVRFNIPTDSGSYYVDLREDEIPLYLQILRSKPAEAKRIMMEKTGIEEPAEIIEAKAKRAEALLPEYLAAGNGERVLAAFDEMSEQQIRNLSLEQKVKAVEAIAASEQAIDFVWNPDNGFYQIHDPALFTHIRNNKDLYQRARFFYPSVQRTVDKLLLTDIIEGATEKRDVQKQRDIGAHLLRILTTGTYKGSHREKSYDNILGTALRFIVDKRIDQETRAQVAEGLSSHYSVEQLTHWQQMATLDENAVSGAFIAYPELFQSIREAVQFNPAESIPGIRDGRISPPKQEQVAQAITDQDIFISQYQKQGIEIKPAMNIALQIMRPTKQLAEAYGVVSRHTDKEGKRIIAPVTVNSEVQVSGLLELESDQRTMDQADDPKIVGAIVDQVRALGDMSTDAEIRIFMGGPPDALTQYTTNQLLLNPTLRPDVKKRVMLVFYNQQDKVFYERPVVMPDQYPLIDAMASLKS